MCECVQRKRETPRGPLPLSPPAVSPFIPARPCFSPRLPPSCSQAASLSVPGRRLADWLAGSPLVNSSHSAPLPIPPVRPWFPQPSLSRAPFQRVSIPSLHRIPSLPAPDRPASGAVKPPASHPSSALLGVLCQRNRGWVGAVCRGKQGRHREAGSLAD